MTEHIIEYDDSLEIDMLTRADLCEEIIRCRDCKHLVAHGAGCAYWDYCDIESADGFCAW